MPPYQYGNPMNDFYIRQAQQLAQNQPQFQQAPHQYQPPLQFPQPAPQAQPQIVASIVTNIDEAKATKVDPYSREFRKALFIGQLYMAAKCLCDDDDVEEELEGAKKYMNEYLDNGESAYKEMARDELKHAGILIKEHYKHADADMKATLEEHENERQELLKRLEKEE